VRCASAGAERRGGGLCADPAYVVIPQAKKKRRQNPTSFFRRFLSRFFRRSLHGPKTPHKYLPQKPHKSQKICAYLRHLVRASAGAGTKY
jgi:hypothetical protein